MTRFDAIAVAVIGALWSIGCGSEPVASGADESREDDVATVTSAFGESGCFNFNLATDASIVNDTRPHDIGESSRRPQPGNITVTPPGYDNPHCFKSWVVGVGQDPTRLGPAPVWVSYGDGPFPSGADAANCTQIVMRARRYTMDALRVVTVLDDVTTRGRMIGNLCASSARPRTPTPTSTTSPTTTLSRAATATRAVRSFETSTASG